VSKTTETYSLKQDGSDFFFQGARVYGIDVTDTPFRQKRVSLSGFQRHCGQQMVLLMPGVLPEGIYADFELRVVMCRVCKTIRERDYLAGLLG